MTALVLTLHIIACLVLVVVVLLQSGKEGMGVIFGGGSQSFFGSSGAGSMLSKITAGCAAIFLLTSLGYNVLVKREVTGSGSSIMLEQPAPEVPAVPKGLFEAPAEEQAPKASEAPDNVPAQ